MEVKTDYCKPKRNSISFIDVSIRLAGTERPQTFGRRADEMMVVRMRRVTKNKNKMRKGASVKRLTEKELGPWWTRMTPDTATQWRRQAFEPRQKFIPGTSRKQTFC